MNNRKRIVIRSMILLAVLMGVILINGCGKISPVAPEQNDATLKQPFGAQQIEDKWGKVFSFSSYNAVVGWVDSGGGTMSFDGTGYEAEFDIPDGAVESWVKLYCQGSAYFTESGMIYVFEFKPDGLVFEKPATLRLEIEALQDFKEGDPYIGAELLYWNDSTGNWDYQKADGDTDGDGIVEFQIEHFSRYAVGGQSQ